ncbi:autophagy-related protein 13 [Sporobolomyces koalae]|uniref:autophagy-related protein 13 n=1 Tax=Sporobolomyces koalae TaxID=500713 RepID=UPI00317C053B
MSWSPAHASSISRPSSRSPPRPTSAAAAATTPSRPLSRSSRWPSPHRDTLPRDDVVPAMTRAHTAPPPRERDPTATTADRDPATKQVDQIVHHFFAKTVAVISQARTSTHAPHSPTLSPDLPSTSGFTAPALRRGVSTASTSTSAGKRKGDKTNSWFNLTLPENDTFRSELKTWKTVSTMLASPAPSATSSSFSSSPSTRSSVARSIPSLFLTVYLDASDLTPNQVLVLSDQQGKRTRVGRNLARPSNPLHTKNPPTRTSSIPRSRSRGGTSTPGSGANSNPHGPATVVLEQWTLSVEPVSDLAATSNTAASLPAVYKHAILHFRSLFTLVKALPTYQLVRKLNRHSANPSRGSGGGNTGGAGRNGTGGLKIGCRVEVRNRSDRDGSAGWEGEIPIDEPIEHGVDEHDTPRTLETLRFPGVDTPLGNLHFAGTYRLNTDFGVEDIETLLSSRFIDEDFFKPTINTARYREQEEAARPGSLPVSAHPGIPATQSRLGTSPSHQSPPITGLGPLPSYGSLSSRHQYAPPPPSAVVAPVSPLTAPVPLPQPTTIERAPAGAGQSIETDQSASANSSSRLSTYGTSVPTRSGIVEPAFISLSRARSGTNIMGIQRASPSAQVGTSGIIRRTSLSGGAHSSSPSSGSPIFRPGSYMSNPSGGAGGGFPGSASPSFGPPSRQQPSSHFPPTANSGSQITFGNRISPLSPPLIPSGPSNLGATAPSRPIPLPNQAAAGAPGRGYSYTSTGGVGSGSWSRSYGRGSSGSGEGEPALSRRGSSKLSFGATGGASSIPRSNPLHAPSSREEEKRFVHQGQPPPDAADINDFLEFLAEKPDLGGSKLGQSGIAGSTILRKKDVDDQLKALRGSVLGFGMGGGGDGAGSPSPPLPAFAVSTASGTSSPRTFGGISNLRRQTSRLSIEEEPAEYVSAAPNPSRMQKEQRPSSEGEESSDNGLTPRPPFRQLRPEIVSPPLSTTSATSTVRHAQPLRSNSPVKMALEPRLYPLPLSSATSPLASPATLPSFSSMYPPLPYPPSKSKASTSTTTTTRTEPIAFSPYISRAARLAQQDRENSGPAAASSSERNSATASIASFSTQGDEMDGGSYRGEEEAVGRLELDDDETTTGGIVNDSSSPSSNSRGRRWPNVREVDEEEICMASQSRDPTPAAGTRTSDHAYRRTPTAAGYFATRSHSRGPVRTTTSPPDSYLH